MNNNITNNSFYKLLELIKCSSVEYLKLHFKNCLKGLEKEIVELVHMQYVYDNNFLLLHKISGYGTFFDIKIYTKKDELLELLKINSILQIEDEFFCIEIHKSDFKTVVEIPLNKYNKLYQQIINI